jgi:hypothetical protein
MFIKSNFYEKANMILQFLILGKRRLKHTMHYKQFSRYRDRNITAERFHVIYKFEICSV